MNHRRSQLADHPSTHKAAATDEHGYEDPPEPVSSETILAVLGDGYARRLLSLLIDSPRTGRELSEETDMSRATVYRRLERLQKNGLVRTEMQIDPDGHHRKEFHATVSGFDFDVGTEGIELGGGQADHESAGRRH
jgi:DNA-binding HxlR family transcriptional regulator